MSWLSAGAALPGGALPEDHAFVDFELAPTASGVVLIGVSAPGAGGGAVSLALNAGLAPSAIDHNDFTGIGATLFQPGSSIARLDGQDVLFVSGQGGAGVGGFSLNSAGAMVAPVSFTASDGLIGSAPSALEVVTLGSRSFAFAGDAALGGIRSYELTTGGHFQARGHQPDDATRYLGGITAFRVVTVAGQPILLSLSGTEDGVMSHRIDPLTGALTQAGRIGADEGLGLAGATRIETAEIGGQTYALVAGTNSSSLSVLRVDPGGALAVTDHLIDTLDSRFANVSALALVQEAGWTFVVAGGGDGGMSLFALLADGMLVHLQSVADSAALTLDSLSALAAVTVGSEIQIIASSETEPGLTYFTLPLSTLGQVLTGGAQAATLSGGAGGDLIQGGSGAETLRGNAGRDLIADGAGSDHLYGGTGADIFVLAADGVADTIHDFQPGEDRLDLSGWHMLYNTGQLDFTSTAIGATLSYLDEVLTIQSMQGTPLSLAQVLPLGIPGPDRPPLVLSEPDYELIGTEAAESLTTGGGNDLIEARGGDDTLDGGAGQDTLRGEAGADVILGGDGNDEIDGGSQWDTIHGGAGDDTVWGGNGADRVWLEEGADVFHDNSQNDLNGADWVSGGAGRDTVWGEGGSDTIEGGDDEDLLYGGVGDDHIDGGNQWDTISAGPGDDTVWGGNGSDTAWLGDGDDVFHDNAQAGAQGFDWIDAGAGRDTVNGGGGNETVLGGDGEDMIFGGDGDDEIDGGAQYDTIEGGAGNDTVRGGLGSDRVLLNAGNDVFLDEPQADANGRDWVEGGNGNDTLHGGGGNDTLFGGAGNDLIEGGTQYDTIHGGAGDDTVDGGGGADLAYLNDGDDLFIDSSQGGIHGRDTVYAGPGNDTIRAGGGDDRFFGEAGADTFIFTAGAGADVIMDFVPGLDMIRFEVPGLDFAGLSITQSGPDAVVGFGADQILLTDVDSSLLTADHFNFV